MTDSEIYEATQEYNKFVVIVNTKEYITKEEYDFCIAYDKDSKSHFTYIGDYSSYGEYLNLNVYSEHDHEKREWS